MTRPVSGYNDRLQGWTLPLAGVLVAIAITATMDATGLSTFSALPLLPLMALFWYIQRLSRERVGFVLGRPRDYALAAIYPVLVIGIIVLFAATSGALDVSRTDWRKAGLNCALITLSTILVAMLTEEGFFRGWLWASLRRAGWNETAVLMLTSLAFSLWHLSAVTLKTGFDLPAAQIPLFMVNAAVLGAAWGLLRSISGSVVVASVSHGLWNGLDYPLFGFGTKVGALGVTKTALYGPEVGVMGLALNVVCVALLWWWSRRLLHESADGIVSDSRPVSESL